MSLTFGSLFAGIGGFDLGFERAGMVCKWQVEINEFCRRVLAKHWPDVHQHDDVRTFPPEGEANAYRVDVICGGFPCQDISLAGKGVGLAGERSGLWFEYARIVRLLRPRFVVMENVAALLVRGLDRVLGTLAEMGYDAEWGCIPASAFGASHIRERFWGVAYSSEVRRDRTVQRVFQRKARWTGIEVNSRWEAEPTVGRVVDGVPSELDKHRLGGLGNAVVPQVAEWIARRLIQHHGE